jgi:hypothetical protein
MSTNRIICPCCGCYHTLGNCPKRWEEFGVWYKHGKCPNPQCVRAAHHRGDCSPFIVDAINADGVGGRP